MQRMLRLAAVLEALADPSTSLHRAASRSSTYLSPASLSTGLQCALAPWDRAGLERLISAEACRMDGALSPARALVVLGGVLPPSHIQAVAYPWLLGAELLIKPPSRDSGFTRLLVDALGRGASLVSEVTDELLVAVDAAVIVGGDATVRSISARLPVGTPRLAFGHRASVTVVRGAGEFAEAVAKDIVTFDQLGCLSPREVLTDTDPAPLARALADRLAAAPDRARLDVPVEGALRGFADAARLAGCYIGPSDLQWGVVTRRGGVYEGTPGGRHVVLRQVDDIAQALEPLRHTLGAVAYAGPTPDAALVSRLIRLGASRIAPAGTLQCPPPSWPHDGVRPLASLCRYADHP